MTQTSKVYMWGQCRGQSICNPTETPFQTLHDVFASFGSPAVTWKSIKLGKLNVSFIAPTPTLFPGLRDSNFVIKKLPVRHHLADAQFLQFMVKNVNTVEYWMSFWASHSRS